MNRILLIGILACVIPFGSAQAAEQQAEHTITVTGTSCVRVVPDLAVIATSITHRHKQLETAMAKTEKGTKETLAALRAFGIEERKIQTTQIRVDEIWENYKRYSLEAYEATQRLTIVLDDLSKYDELMTVIVKAGITNLDSIEFQTSTPRKFKDEARQMALTAAREKASDMAAVLGQRITHPVTITENSTSNYGGWRGPQYSTMNSNVSWSSSETPEADENLESLLAPGELKLIASVTVTFAFEPAPQTNDQVATHSADLTPTDSERPATQNE